jgi:hypothetical protein
MAKYEIVEESDFLGREFSNRERRDHREITNT